MSNAIFYVNSSHSDSFFIREADHSASSFRKFFNDTDFVLFTDLENFDSENFDQVIDTKFFVPEKLKNAYHKNGQMEAKIRALGNTDYTKTLYLGSDTYAIKPAAAEIFDLLDRFDIVASHAPLRINTELGADPISAVPSCFPELNCDVLGFRRNKATLAFMREWHQLYMEHAFQHAHDQGAFRFLLYQSNLQLAVLPPEFNYRGWYWRPDTVILQNRDTLPLYRKIERGEAISIRQKAKQFLISRLDCNY